MKRFTFNKQFMVLMFLLLNCFASYAADEDLITEQITLNLTKAGTLPNKIASSKKNLVTNLKIIGEINGNDLRLIREMAGCNAYGYSTSGNLSVLDLSEARIVEGGYYYDNGGKFTTSNDIIGEYTFYNCTSLSSVNIPSSVTRIGKSAFEGCTSLTSVDIPSSVTEINLRVFKGCTSLTIVDIPSSVTRIGESAFEGCSSLKSVNIPSNVTEINLDVFKGCTSLTSVNIPSSMKWIPVCAFYNCSSLTSVKIPSSVNFIGYGAFLGCEGLKSIYIYAEKAPYSSSSMSEIFSDCVLKNGTLYVPNGTYDAYNRSLFGDFENIVEFDATSIHNMVATPEAQETARYAVNGQRLTAPIKGINLVKYSDGTVKKEFVK